MWVETMEGEEARIVKWMADSVGCDTPKLHFGEGFFFFFFGSVCRDNLFFSLSLDGSKIGEGGFFPIWKFLASARESVSRGLSYPER